MDIALARVLRYLCAVSGATSVRHQREIESLHGAVLRRLGFANSDPATNGEAHFLRELPALRDASPVVFDVGANRGDFAGRVLECVGVDAVVYCFEPSAAAFARLEDRFGSNPQVRLFNFGLSDDEGESSLYADIAGSTLGSLYRRQVEGVLFEPIERVQVRRVDRVCEELGVERIDLLKVDAEGNDLQVLRGCGRLLDGLAIRAVQFEHGGTAIDARIFLRDFFDLLTPAYVIHRVLPDGLWPIERHREPLEVPTYANYVGLPATT